MRLGRSLALPLQAQFSQRHCVFPGARRLPLITPSHSRIMVRRTADRVSTHHSYWHPTMTAAAPARPYETHSLLIGYLCWLFGFLGMHRFYFGKPITGTIWFFTLGLLGIGWVIDLFLIPGMQAKAERRYVPGPVDYSVAWLLLVY